MFSQILFWSLGQAWAYEPSSSLQSFEQLRSHIEDNRLYRLESVLASLPEDLRARFTLMKDSLSLQNSTPSNPRAILFGKDADLILTFNGAPYQSGFNRIEVLDHDKNDGQFRLYEIRFSQDGSQPPQFSKPNPSKCLECHSSSPKPNGLVKPIWDNYPNWLGAYGARANQLDRTEIEQYKVFRQQAQSHPRYKHLIFRDDKTDAYPYFIRRQNADASFAVNTVLGQYLDARNSVNVYSRLKTSPLYPYLRAAFVYTSACYNLDESITINLRQQLETSHHFLFMDLSRAMGVSPDAWSLAFSESLPFYTNGANSIAIDALESGLGLQDFNTFSFVNQKILDEIVVENPDLKTLIRPLSWKSRSGQYGILGLDRLAHTTTVTAKRRDRFCAKIESITRNEIRHLPEALSSVYSPKETTSPPARFGCVSCHETHLIGPYIPFSIPSLATALYGGRSAFLKMVENKINKSVPNLDDVEDLHRQKRKMPLGRAPLSPEESRQLLDFLSQ